MRNVDGEFLVSRKINKNKRISSMVFKIQLSNRRDTGFVSNHFVKTQNYQYKFRPYHAVRARKLLDFLAHKGRQKMGSAPATSSVNRKGQPATPSRLISQKYGFVSLMVRNGENLTILGKGLHL